ncbi:hypothetical protein [Streptomyces sp. NPDC088350]|uniref:hypothetical protein n=1 Tax=Streptomyces sp. NPDC088350 TaxID=3365854 RepID=UPI00382CF0AF
MNRTLLTTRSALIFLLGILCGTGTGILTAFTGASPAGAVLSGMAALGFAVPFFNTLVD